MGGQDGALFYFMQVALHFFNIWMNATPVTGRRQAVIMLQLHEQLRSSASSQSGKLTPEASDLAPDTRREGTETPDAGM